MVILLMSDPGSYTYPIVTWVLVMLTSLIAAGFACFALFIAFFVIAH